MAGLLHDIGQVVWAHFRPELYVDVLKTVEETGCSTNDAEQHVLGSTHGELGGLLAEKWQFSPELIDAIRFHHTTPDDTYVDVMRDAVYLASLLAHAHTHGIDNVSLTEMQRIGSVANQVFVTKYASFNEEIQEAGLHGPLAESNNESEILGCSRFHCLLDQQQYGTGATLLVLKSPRMQERTSS